MALQVKTYTDNGSLRNLAISTRAVDLIAPAGVFWQIDGLTEDMYLTAGFIWLVNDGAGGYSLLPTEHPMASTSKEQMLGPKAARVFDTAGTYAVECFVIYKGAWNVLRSSVTVEASSAHYDDSNTYYYDPSGTFSDEAAGATNQYTSLGTLLSAAGAAGVDFMLLGARGQTHTSASSTQIRFDSGSLTGLKMTLGSYGTGALFEFDNKLIPRAFDKCKIIDVNFTSGWDTTTETGTTTNGLEPSYYDDPSEMLIHRCTFNGIEAGVSPISGAADGLIIVSECDMTNWQNFAVFGGNAPTTTIVMIGNKMAQDLDALGGGSGVNNTGNRHGPFRGYADTCLIWGNYLVSVTGWGTQTANASLGGGSIPAHQQCLRCLSTPNSGAEWVVAGNVMEGGRQVLSLARSANDPGTFNSPVRLVVCSNILIGTANTVSHAGFSYGGTSFYNNVLIQPNVTSETSTLFSHWIAIDDDQGEDKADPSNFEHPIYIRNNTMVYSGTDQFNESGTGGYDDREALIDTYVRGADPVFAGSAYEDNHIVASTRSWSPTADTIDRTALWDAVYKGFRWSGSTTLNTTYATPSGSVFLAQPTSFVASTGTPPEIDFLGNVRSASTCIGAFDAIVS